MLSLLPFPHVLTCLIIIILSYIVWIFFTCFHYYHSLMSSLDSLDMFSLLSFSHVWPGQSGPVFIIIILFRLDEDRVRNVKYT